MQEQFIVAADETLNISELFYSIQGESTWAGMPCVFIRLAGCNLRCTYCDAAYTYEEEGLDYSWKEIIAFTEKYPKALIEFTGGEPFLQDNIYPLIDTLIAANRTVLVETNGSILLDKAPNDIVKIMDIKCPDSGMHEKIDLENLDFLNAKDNLKFVLSSRKDFDWAVQFLHQHLPEHWKKKDSPAILFSPVPDRLEIEELAQWILEEEVAIQLQVQLHKIIWPTETRGV